MNKQIEQYLANNKYINKETLNYTNYSYSQVFENKNTVLIFDHDIEKLISKEYFPYSLYTNFQNKYVDLNKTLFRFYDEVEYSNFELFLNKDLEEFESWATKKTQRLNDPSPLESHFEKLLKQVYGLDIIEYLYKEFPIISLKNQNIFIDYLIKKSSGEKIAVEENGVNFHHPQIIGKSRYIHQLEKQNLCSKLGIKLYRFSTEDCKNEDKTKDLIYNHFGKKQDFIKRSIEGEREFKLYEHQENALNTLKELHKKNNSSALFVFPTATGKSEIILRNLDYYYSINKNFKALIISPTIKITEQWKTDVINKPYYVEFGTYNLIWKKRDIVPKDYYDYIVVDEAHHAVAPMTKNALEYFTPKLLVGLTATPDRPDKKRLEEVFGEYSTNLTLQEAIDKNIVSPIRAYRIKTNLDLSEIRCNGKDFVNSDLEKSIKIPSRNELIAEVLNKYFKTTNQKGVIFCISTAHTKVLAKLLNDYGLSSKALSSKEKAPSKILDDFHNNKFRFLCVCDMVNEGWNEPNIEILVMARPTLSKVLYQQQLGRGIRKAKGKKCVYIIDVVDQYGSLNVPWSTHSLFNINSYIPFGDINKTYNTDEVIEINGLYETITSIETINLTTFETEFEGLYDSEQTARELFVSTDSLMDWIKNKEVEPTRILPFGNRKLYYFNKENIEKIRNIKNLIHHNEKTIKKDFFEFINKKNFTFSFKIVFLLGFMKNMNQYGEVDADILLKFYQNFYLTRIKNNLPVDKKNCIYTKDFLMDFSKLKKNMLKNPFEKFERKRFLYYSKEINHLSLNSNLFKQLNKNEINNIINILNNQLNEYYENLI